MLFQMITKRYFLWFVLVFIGVNFSYAQDANSIKAELKLTGLTKDFQPVMQQNIWSAIVDSAKAEIKLTVNPRKASGLSTDQLTEEEYVGCKITRYYNDSAKELTEETMDEFMPVQGELQTVKYVAVFEYKSRSRTVTNEEYSEWSEWTSKTEEADVTTLSFNVFPKCADPIVTKGDLITYANGLERNFQATVNSQTGNPLGWTVDWTEDGLSKSKQAAFTFMPGADAGTKRIGLVVKNLAPDKKTVWYTYTEEMLIKVYADPHEAEITYIEPNIIANTTYCKKADCNYSVIISAPENYGTWFYSWERNDGAKSETNEIQFLSDEQKKGTYITNFNLKCVNPNNEEEIWYVSSRRFTLNIYSNPYDVEPEYEYPQGAKANTYVNRINNQPIYRCIVNDDANYGRWTYRWTMDGLTYNGSVYSFTPREAKTYEILSQAVCANPNDSRDVWRTIEESYVLNVYKDPQKVEFTYNYPEGGLLASHKGLDCARKYELEASVSDLQAYGQWIYSWKRNGVDVSSGNSANIDNDVQPGEYETVLTIRCVNPDDESEVWREVSGIPQFGKYLVYTQPQRPIYQSRPEKMFVAMNDDTYEDFVFAKNATGNPEGWVYFWNGVETDTYRVDVTTTTFPNFLALVGSWKNVNPMDPDDVWLEGSDSYEIYVCPKIGNPIITNPANLVITTDSVANFRVEAPSDIVLPKGWQWCFTWISSTQGFVGEGTQLAYNPAEDAGKTPIISCRMEGLTSDGKVWFNDSFSAAQLIVFNSPKCEEQDVHAHDDFDVAEYSMFVGQTFDTGNLYTITGGYTDGWQTSLSVNGAPQNNMLFTPTETGEYSLTLNVANNATLSNGKKQEWYNENRNYKFVVYEKPDTLTNLEQLDGLDDLHIVKDEKVTWNVRIEGGMQDAWKVNWMVDPEITYTTENMDSDYKFEMQGLNETTEDSVVYTIQCNVSNEPRNIAEACMFKSNIVKKIIVWKDITAHIDNLVYRTEDDTYVMETCEGLWDGNAERISFQSIGGDSNKWSIECAPEEETPVAEFQKQGRKLFNDFGNLNADGDRPKDYRYMLTAHYNNGISSRSFNYNVLIRTWPKPEIRQVAFRLKDKPETDTRDIQFSVTASDNAKSIAADCYSGDEIRMYYTLVGGKSDTEGAWAMRVNGEETNVDYVAANPFTHPMVTGFHPEMSGTDEYVTNQYDIAVVHRYNGAYYTSKQEWYKSDDYKLDVATYPQPDVKPELHDSSLVVKWGQSVVDVYAGGFEGNKVNMKYTHQKGNTDGWTFSWYVDDTLQSTDIDQWTYVPYAVSASEEKTLKVRIVNSLPSGNKGMSEVHEYPIRVWRKAEFADAFSLTDANQGNRDITNGHQAIRKSNTLKGSVDPIRYGYDKGHTYEWLESVSKEREPNWEVLAGTSANGNEKDKESQDFGLRMYINGPYGHVWDSKSMDSQSVKVYNKPATPKSLVRKGDGSSCTMIATTDITDQNLENRDYYLVFGYTDAAGDHDYASQKQSNPGQVRWSSRFSKASQMTNAYVYALWKYNDGTEITSGKCTLSGRDESYDSSSYDGHTRSVLDNETTALDEIRFAEQDGTAEYYTLDGKKVNSTHLLTPGIYLKSYVIDGVSMTKKIVVK